MNHICSCDVVGSQLFNVVNFLKDVIRVPVSFHGLHLANANIACIR